MGKRELLLIVAFVIVGAVVYQATAPAPGPNDRGISFSGIIEKIRREMRGNRARAEEMRVTTHELDPGMAEVRVAGFFAELTITGQNRTNIEARFHVTSNAYDEAEAKQLLAETQLIVDRAGSTLRLSPKYPRPGRHNTTLTLLVPARLAARVDQGAARTSVSGVAAVEIPGVRGETSLKNIAGRVTVTHRAGRIVIEDVAALKLDGRGSEATVSKVRGDASFSMQTGELNAQSIGGPIDVDSQSADVVLRKLEEAQGPLRVNARAGSVTLEGLKGDTRIDGRNTEIDITMSKPATIAVYNEGDEPIEITPPPGGFLLDAIVTQGRITLPEELQNRLTIINARDDKEQRVNGPVRGGGPMITLRANRGDIRIRARDGKKPEESTKSER